MGGGSKNKKQTHAIHGQGWFGVGSPRALDPWKTHPGHVGWDKELCQVPSLEGTSFSTGNMGDVVLGRGFGWEEATGLSPQVPQAAES